MRKRSARMTTGVERARVIQIGHQIELSVFLAGLLLDGKVIPLRIFLRQFFCHAFVELFVSFDNSVRQIAWIGDETIIEPEDIFSLPLLDGLGVLVTRPVKEDASQDSKTRDDLVDELVDRECQNGNQSGFQVRTIAGFDEFVQQGWKNGRQREKGILLPEATVREQVKVSFVSSARREGIRTVLST